MQLGLTNANLTNAFFKTYEVFMETQINVLNISTDTTLINLRQVRIPVFSNIIHFKTKLSI